MGVARFLLCTLLAACINPDQVPCGDLLCPAGTVCLENAFCASPQQVEACVGLTDGAACSFGGSVGACQQGACVAVGCGNGVLDPGEVCDGTLGVDTGRCATDCGRIEICGNAVVDPDEQCDDGNTNAVDGCDSCVATVWSPRVIIGGTALDATMVALSPAQLAFDRTGNLYIADYSHGRVLRLDPAGVLSVVAGTGVAGDSGDGGAATSAQLRGPTGVAVDGLGNVYIADTPNQRVRRVDAAGVITTVAGTGIGGYNGDGIEATSAQLFNPISVVVDGLGNLYISELANGRVRRVDHVTNIITTVAAIGGLGLALDPDGRVVVSAYATVSRIEANGSLTIIAGNGTYGASGDGGQAVSAQLGVPQAIAYDSAGNLLIADPFSGLRIVDANGVITTAPGTATLGPSGVTVDATGRLFFSAARRVWRQEVTSALTPVAGNGEGDSNGDGGSARRVAVGGGCIAITNDRLYVCNDDRVRVVENGVIETAAGTIEGFGGDNGPATEAKLRDVMGLGIDGSDLLIADTNNNRIRRVDANGVITTIAGDGSFSWNQGDNGPATSCPLASPRAVTADADGNVFIGVAYTDQIHEVDTSGTIRRIAGTLGGPYSGDGGPAVDAGFNNVTAFAAGADGNLYVGDAHRVRRVTPGGTVITVAGTGTPGYSGDGGDALLAELQDPSALAFDSAGNLYVADAGANVVRRIDTNNTITTVVGTGSPGNGGDGGAALDAQLDLPSAIAFDSLGQLYISDADRVRRIDLTGTITTVVGAIETPGTGPISMAQLVDPTAFVVQPTFTFIAGGTYGVLERLTASALEVVAGRYPQTTATGTLARFRDKNFGTIGGVAFDPSAGVIYLSETTANRLYAVTIVDPADATTWTIAALANVSGTGGYTDGPAAAARFLEPTGLYFDVTGKQLYVADTGNHAVRAIDLASGAASATVRTVAGTGGVRGFFGDGGSATSALLYEPRAVTQCPNGDLFVADTSNQRIRRIAAGTITTVLGIGAPASPGDGAPASAFPVDSPRGLACDASGNVFVTSRTAVRLLPANVAQIVDGQGAVQTIYGALPTDTFPENVTRCITGVAIVDASAIQILDSCAGMLLELRRAPVTP